MNATYQYVHVHTTSIAASHASMLVGCVFEYTAVSVPIGIPTGIAIYDLGFTCMHRLNVNVEHYY